MKYAHLIQPTNIQIDYTNHLNNLKSCFNDCSINDLQTILEHKQLPIGKNKIYWYGAKAAAIRFIEHFDITKAQFNKMFYFEDGKPLHAGNKDKNEIYSDKLNKLSK